MAVLPHLLRQPGGRPPRVAEDHGLANGDGAVDVGDAPVLGLRGLTVHVALLDVIL